jgi:hypothetical protein
MGWRFRRSFGLAPGARVTLGKQSLSSSIGLGGLRLTSGAHGTQATVSLPGSGVSYTFGRSRRSTAIAAGGGGLILLQLIAIGWAVGHITATLWGFAVFFGLAMLLTVPPARVIVALACSIGWGVVGWQMASTPVAQASCAAGAFLVGVVVNIASAQRLSESLG